MSPGVLRCDAAPSPMKHHAPHASPPLGRARFGAGAGGLILLTVFFAAGCTTPTQTVPATDSTKYTLESTERFAALDRAAQQSIDCTGLLEHPLADGRTEVVANLRNQDPKPVTIETSCHFRDPHGLTTLEETAWQSVTIPGNATIAVRFTTAKTTGPVSKYTVRVRSAR